jgi:hypothetical protein
MPVNLPFLSKVQDVSKIKMEMEVEDFVKEMEVEEIGYSQKVTVYFHEENA